MRRSFFIWMLIVLPGVTSSAQQYYFREYTPREGLHHSFIYSIGQDMDGYLWIGTAEGLYSFNGFEFEHITEEDGLADDFVASIYRDRTGKMWIGHQNGSFSIKTKKGFVILNDESGIHGSVTDIIEDENGTVWATVQNQGIISVNKNLEIKEVLFSKEQEQLTQIRYAGSGMFIIGTQENLYTARYNSTNGSLDILKQMEEYPGSKVVEIIITGQNTFMVVSQEDGLFGLEVDSTSDHYSFTIIDPNTDGSLDHLQGGILDTRGTIWLHSMGKGLIQYQMDDQQQVTKTGMITTKNGLVSGNVKSIYEDFEGSIWLGMFGDGLLRYVDNNLMFYSFALDGELEETLAIAGNSERLLFSTGNRLLEMDLGPDTVIHTFQLPFTNREDRLNTAYLANDGRIWLGYDRSGLYVSNKRDPGFSSVYISRDNLSRSINHITERDGSIWVGTKKGICKITETTSSITWFTTDQGLPHNNIKQLYIDSKNRILVATLCSELYYISENDEVSKLEGSKIGPFNEVVSIAESNDGSHWLATQGNGVWKIVANENLNFTSASGLLSDYCYSLILSIEGQPCVTHRGGISLIDPETNKIKTFGRLEGVISSTEFFLNCVFRDPLDHIWFGTSEGLLKFSPNLTNSGTMPPRLMITAVLIDGDTIKHTEGRLLLKPGQYELEVNYIGISLSNPEMVFYQTKLEGYNNDWSTPTFSRNVILSRIGHGDYTFMIRAYNQNDIQSEISNVFELKIKKPLYLSIWFYLVVALLIGASFYMVLRIRERNLRMVQERLLRNLDEKTKEVIVKEEIIKERKKVEKVLIEAKAKAELSEQLKTSFLQNMSHEIRTPMNAIVGFSQLLKEEGITKEMKDECVDNVSNNANSLLALIDDILDVSKLETNQLTIKNSMCNVNKVVQGLTSSYKEKLIKLKKDEVEILADCPPGKEIEMNTDVTRLTQVLSKLLDNAIKYTEKGSIQVGFKPKNGNVEFFVEDTGIGLSEDKKDIIFDLFRKIEDDKLKLYGGTGLGLTLSRYLINLMGGEIHVESEENVGSKFYFLLPFENDKQDTAGESTNGNSKYEGVLTGKRILVVEDIDSNYLLLEKYLSPLDATLVRTSTGLEALNLYFNEGPFDLVLMDIRLPGLNGYETTQRIREKDTEVPIIAHTALAMEGDEEKSLNAGCNAYITKPIDKKKLLSMVIDFILYPERIYKE